VRGSRNVFGRSPSPARVNRLTRLNHFPGGTSGSDASQSCNSSKSATEIRKTERRLSNNPTMCPRSREPGPRQNVILKESNQSGLPAGMHPTGAKLPRCQGDWRICVQSGDPCAGGENGPDLRPAAARSQRWTQLPAEWQKRCTRPVLTIRRSRWRTHPARLSQRRTLQTAGNPSRSTSRLNRGLHRSDDCLHDEASGRRPVAIETSRYRGARLPTQSRA